MWGRDEEEEDVRSAEEEEDMGSSEGDVEKLSPCLQ